MMARVSVGRAGDDGHIYYDARHAYARLLFQYRKRRRKLPDITLPHRLSAR